MNQPIYLVEDTPLDYSFPANALIIAIDPTACYKLDKMLVTYKIIEDFYDEKSLWLNEDAYFIRQIRWFLQMDQSLNSVFKQDIIKSPDFFMNNFLRFKYITDTMHIFAAALKGFFDQFPKADSVHYMHSNDDSKISLFDFTLSNRAVFLDILRCFSKERGFILKTLPIGTKKAAIATKQQEVPLQDRLFIRKILKGLQRIKHYNKRPCFLLNENKSPYTYCFLHAGSTDIDEPIRALLQKGAKVYVHENQEIICESDLFRRRTAQDKTASASAVYNTAEVAENLAANSVFAEGLEDFGLSFLKPLWRRYLLEIFEEEIPALTRKMLFFHQFFKNAQIDFVVVRGNTDLEGSAALSAAALTATTKRVGIQHSNFGLKKDIFLIFEVNTYDYILTRDNLSAAYFEKYQLDVITQMPRMIQSPHYLKSFLKSESKRSARKNSILYLETRYPSHVRVINNPTYSLCWHYQLQKKIIDYMGSQPDFHFIFKHAPRRDYTPAILSYLSDKGYSNIEIMDKPFGECLNHVDKVFMDFFSTAFYEAEMLKIPTLCLNSAWYRWIPEIVAHFGSACRTFHSDDEALGLLDEFIHSDGSGYVKTIPMSAHSVGSAVSELEQFYDQSIKQDGRSTYASD